MGAAYPELSARFALIRETIVSEEENFLATLDVGLKLLDEEAAKVSGKILSGEAAFKLYDTYGFPLDLTEDILKKRGMTVDTAGFESAMAKQREMSRAKSAFRGEAGISKAFADLIKGVEVTEFVGYGTLSTNVKVVKAEVFDGAKYVILDRTPFYAESGGQVADGGTLGGAEVKDVQKIHGVFLHKLPTDAKISAGDKVECKVDAAARTDTARNHSAAHLLQAAMKKVLGEHVAQRGSLVSPDVLRFDFANPRALSPEEIAKIEVMVNEWIKANPAVTVCSMSLDEAKKSGVTALFGEKYGEVVRVVTMGSQSRELCGGTHVENVGDIGFFKITKEESISAGTRRITAITGRQAQEFAKKYNATTIEELQQKLARQAEDEAAAKAKEREANKKLEADKLASDLAETRTAAKEEGSFIYAVVDIDVKNLKDAAATLRKPGTTILVMAGANYRLEAEPELIKKLKPVLIETLGGTGGGSGNFLQGRAAKADAPTIATALAAIKKAL